MKALGPTLDSESRLSGSQVAVCSPQLEKRSSALRGLLYSPLNPASVSAVFQSHFQGALSWVCGSPSTTAQAFTGHQMGSPAPSNPGPLLFTV